MSLSFYTHLEYVAQGHGILAKQLEKLHAAFEALMKSNTKLTREDYVKSFEGCLLAEQFVLKHMAETWEALNVKNGGK